MKRTIEYKKNNKGWIIVIGCMLIQAIPFAITSNIQPQFMQYVISDKGFTLAGFSLIFTISSIVGALVSPIIGALYTKINPKIILVVGAVLSGVGFFSFGLSNYLWQFYVVGGITQIGTAAISSIGVPLLISSWFSEEVKGRAMGFAFAGGAFGNIFIQQLTAIALINNGYKKSYFIFGATSLIVGVLVSIFILRMPKNDSEIVKGDKGDKENKKEQADISYSLSEVKGLEYFWIYSLAFILIGLYISAVLVQYPTYLKVVVNIPPKLIGFIGSIVAVFSLVGNLVGGVLFDKLGVTKCIVLAGVSATIGCTMLALTEVNSNLAFVFAAFIGLSIFSYIMGIAYMTGTFFGKKNYAAILGIVNVMFAIGFSLGSSFFGLVIENIGYRLTWITVTCIVAIAYCLIIITSIAMEKINRNRKKN